MSARTAAYKMYVVFALVALAGCTWWLMRVKDAIPDEQTVLDAKPTRHTPAPDFERFPYERGGDAVLTAMRRREITGDIPVVWLRGNGVLVRKKNELDDTLDYERTVIAKKAIDVILGRLLDGAEASDPGESGLIVTLTGKDEVRTFRLPSTAGLLGEGDEALDGSTWKTARLRHIKVSAIEAPSEAAIKWPISRLPLRSIIAEGSIVSTIPEINGSLQKRVSITGFYQHDDKTWLVTAIPSVDG